jgi:hypothetical protein
MSESFTCWKCGSPLPELLLPLPRQEECLHCRAQLHVCRMCVYFDPAVAQQCREPVAEPVSDKQRANFCGYFQPKPQALSTTPDPAEASRRQLDALFGGAESPRAGEDSGTENPSPDALERLFRK